MFVTSLLIFYLFAWIGSATYVTRQAEKRGVVLNPRFILYTKLTADHHKLTKQEIRILNWGTYGALSGALLVFIVVRQFL
ncbi:hypothetical protein PVV74_00630 [Roseovarius sp. SK2]|uniref:hypothetical protein n=1 Tax=Roseovarius TaxID=74030 RepID=UPI00237C1190|nr:MULTISPECIES: hypothetical protein [unclassified Roseovarius]MDD9723949.1 hypothetical protein [Roseovarius sp. SK2]